MDWYCALTEYSLKKDNIVVADEPPQFVLRKLERKVVALYREILHYQMRSVCSYYRNWFPNILRGFANWDDWDGYLKIVKQTEDELRKDLEQYNNEHAKSSLRQLVEITAKMPRDIRQVLQDLHRDEEDTKCVQQLRVVDPRVDMKKIEDKKDKLLDDAYKWILGTEEYAALTNWSDDEPGLLPCRLLWIKGQAGTGKTMLLIGIIRELSRPSMLAPNVSHFFCQGTEPTLNNVTATLRSLVWMLLVQQPHLVTHLREKYKISGPALFTDRNAFYDLSETFQSMVKDPRLSPVYLAVDALDECDQTVPGLDKLIELISDSLDLSNKVRWLVSSRPEVDVVTKLKNPGISRIVRLDDKSLKVPVEAYIKHKLPGLKGNPGYDEKTLEDVSNKIRGRAGNTFLWVWHVFQVLGSEKGWNAADAIDKIPTELSKVYDHMMTRIELGTGGDLEHCKSVLVVATLAYRPLSFSELEVLAELPPGSPQTIVEECGSFLTANEETVYLIHQSAKEYLDKNHHRLQPGGVAQGHADITRRSVAAMSTLKTDIYDRRLYGFQSKDIKPPNPDPLAPMRYCCVFWLDHLRNAINGSPENGKEIYDLGFKFLKVHFLHWLESLSLLRRLSDGIISVRELLKVIQVCL
jgi:hypothetical protein